MTVYTAVAVVVDTAVVIVVDTAVLMVVNTSVVTAVVMGDSFDGVYVDCDGGEYCDGYDGITTV